VLHPRIPQRKTCPMNGKLAKDRARIVRTGFDRWFHAKAGGTPPGAWKQNMLVLLLLYPVVFLFFTFVQAPLLTGRAGLSFAVALFIANAVSVLLLSYWCRGRPDGSPGGLHLAVQIPDGCKLRGRRW
jgi:antibiotic biosynthesis monooxygenase (ABM) superfamily enzyme